MNRQLIIITGAAGFIGGACVREFLAAGWFVIALIHRRPPDNLIDLRDSSRLSFARASIADSASLLSNLDQAVKAINASYTAVVHCAGRATDVGRSSEFKRSNYEGVKNICLAVQQLSINRLVHISTTDVYGVDDFDQIKESAPMRNNRGNNYPKYKIMAELHLREALPPEKYTILRPALVWGPGDTTVMPRALEFLRSSPFIIHFGSWRGENLWPLAYIGNVTRVARVAARAAQAAGQTYNIADIEPTTITQYYQMLIDCFLPGMERKKTLVLPGWIGRLSGMISSICSDLLNRNQPLFDPSLYSFYHISHSQSFDSSRAAILLAEAKLKWIDRQTALRELKAGSTE